ncbi:MAG TPA: polyprenyl synthetase family protein, partial [Phenylobacterium sp.]
MTAIVPTREVLASRRAAIEAELRAIVPDSTSSHRLGAAMRYAVVSPGKRIRPLLAVLCAEHLGCDLERILAPACALELVHAASLVLDDVPCMDDAAERRGQPSVHARFGEEVALLAVVALVAEAYAQIVRAPGLSDRCRTELVRVLSEIIGPKGLTGGQELDLRRGQTRTAVEVSELHQRKTGALFVGAVEVAALVAEADTEQRAALRRFAEELGLAFQFLDDIADADDELGSTANVISVMGREAAERGASRRL